MAFRSMYPRRLFGPALSSTATHRNGIFPMVSLTLPIAALFAATIIYGRFSQDNELMACRASGICTLSLLRPAVWLGVVVSIVTRILATVVVMGLGLVFGGLGLAPRRDLAGPQSGDSAS